MKCIFKDKEITGPYYTVNYEGFKCNSAIRSKELQVNIKVPYIRDESTLLKIGDFETFFTNEQGPIPCHISEC